MSAVLSPDQELLLSVLAKEKHITSSFYLSGGTALAEYYLQHRFSEDLDFCSEDKIDIEGLSALINKIGTKVGITEVTFEQSLSRNLFFVRTARSTV